MKNLLKHIESLDDTRLRLRTIKSGAEIENEILQEGIALLYKMPGKAKHALAVFLKAIYFNRKPYFLFSQKDLQTLIDQDPDLVEKFELRNDSSKAWQGFTSEADGVFVRILIPSNKNNKKPAVIEVIHPDLLAVIDKPSEDLLNECKEAVKPQGNTKKQKPQGFNKDNGSKFQDCKLTNVSINQETNHSNAQGSNSSIIQDVSVTQTAHQDSDQHWHKLSNTEKVDYLLSLELEDNDRNFLDDVVTFNEFNNVYTKTFLAKTYEKVVKSSRDQGLEIHNCTFTEKAANPRSPLSDGGAS